MMGFARRLTPFTVWLGLCALLGSVALTEAALHQRWQNLQAARSAYLLAIADTQLKLTQLMSRVGGDGALAQNLKWKLSHSVRATLDGMLEKGQLDLIALFGQGCSDLGRAGSAALAVQCPSAESLRGKGTSFQWSSTQGATTMALMTPLDGTEVNLVAAVGVVSLDDQWLSLQSGLHPIIQSLGLRFGQSGGVTLVEPVNTRGGDGATLRSDQLIDKLIYSRAVQRWFFHTSLVWPCLLLTLGWGLYVLWREAGAAQRTNTQVVDFTAWCRSLASSSAAIAPPSVTTAEGLVELNLGLPIARSLVNHALQVKNEAMHGLRHKRQTLEAQLKTKEDELQKLKVRLAELAELDSLAVQLKRTTAIFLQRMDSFHSDVDDLDQIAAKQIGHEGNALLRLATQWQHGIAARGARKFIRSLAETPHDLAASPQDGQTQDLSVVSELDVQLADYYQHSLQLSDLAITTQRITGQLQHTASFAARLAALWHGLALKSHDAEPCDSLLAPMEEAQALVQLEPDLLAACFINPEAEDLERNLPAVPKPIWISSLYHVYIALAELAKGESAQVVTRLRGSGTKTLLVIQVSSTAGKPLPQRSERQAYHLEISRAMLAPFHISLSVLPALDGPYPIVLTWSPPDLNETGALPGRTPAESDLADHYG